MGNYTCDCKQVQDSWGFQEFGQSLVSIVGLHNECDETLADEVELD